MMGIMKDAEPDKKLFEVIVPDPKMEDVINIGDVVEVLSGKYEGWVGVISAVNRDGATVSLRRTNMEPIEPFVVPYSCVKKVTWGDN